MILPSFNRILSIILLFSIIHVIDVRSSGFDSQSISVMAQPHTNVSRPKQQPEEWQKPKHSTACNPLPWRQNPELYTAGIELLNVSYKLDSTPEYDEDGNEVGIDDSFNLNIDFVLSGTMKNVRQLINSKLLPADEIDFDVEGLNTIEQNFYSGRSLYFEKYDLVERLNDTYRFYIANKHGEFSRLWNLEFISIEQPGFSKYNTPFFRFTVYLDDYAYPQTIALVVDGESPIYFSSSNLTLASDFVASVGNYQKLKNCSTFMNPLPIDTVTENSGVQVEVLGAIPTNLISSIVSSSPNLRILPEGYRYEVIRFLVRNVGAYKNEYSTIWNILGPTSLISQTKKSFAGKFVYPNEINRIIDPMMSGVVHVAYTIPLNEKIISLSLCTQCKEPSIMTTFLTYKNELLEDQESVNTVPSRNTASTSFQRIGQTAVAENYSLRVEQVKVGHEAIDYLCSKGQCTGKFLTVLDNFQRKNKVDFAMIRVAMQINHPNNPVARFELKKFSIRSIGQINCVQMPYEVKSQGKAAHVTDCVAMSPENIHGYNLTGFKDIFDLTSEYVDGAVITGWIRFWVPRLKSSNILVIDPFPRKDNTKIDSRSTYCSPPPTRSPRGFWTWYADNFATLNDRFQFSKNRMWSTDLVANEHCSIDEKSYVFIAPTYLQSDDVVYFHYR